MYLDGFLTRLISYFFKKFKNYCIFFNILFNGELLNLTKVPEAKFHEFHPFKRHFMTHKSRTTASVILMFHFYFKKFKNHCISISNNEFLTPLSFFSPIPHPLKKHFVNIDSKKYKNQNPFIYLKKTKNHVSFSLSNPDDTILQKKLRNPPRLRTAAPPNLNEKKKKNNSLTFEKVRTIATPSPLSHPFPSIQAPPTTNRPSYVNLPKQSTHNYLDTGIASDTATKRIMHT